MTWKSNKKFYFIFILSLIFIIYFFDKSISGLLNKIRNCLLRNIFSLHIHIKYRKTNDRKGYSDCT